MKLTAASVDDTRGFGSRVATIATPGDVFALDGDLGTGKTEFVRGFVGALAPSVIVRSPSFAIVHRYPTPAFPIYHFDFYRLYDTSELIEIGFEEYLSGNGVCIIEWATMFSDALPDTARYIHFRDRGITRREIEYGFVI